MNLDRNYTHSTRRFVLDTNLTPTFAMSFDKFDVEDYVKAFASANVNCLFQIAKDHWGHSTYDTSVGIKHPQLKIDLLAEVIKHAHAHNVKVNAYYSLEHDSAVIEKHPGWSRRDIKGNLTRYHWHKLLTFGNPCFNSPYRQYVLDQLTEIAKNYDADLFWIDCVAQGDAGAPGCYCEYCRKAYREKFGKEIPAEARWDKEWKQYVNWRLDLLEKFWEDILATIHTYKPGFPVSRNHAWYTRTQRVRLAKGEIFLDADVGGDCGAGAAVLRGLTGNKAFHFGICACKGSVQEWVSPYRHKLETLNHLTQGGISVYGEYESVYYPDGTFEKEIFTRVGASFGERAQKEKYIQRTVSMPYVGVLYSDTTKTFYRGNDVYQDTDTALRGSKDDYLREDFLSTLTGAISTLLSMHIPFNVIAEWDIGSDVIKEYPILILPNVAAMSEKQVEALKKYVAKGGLLLGTFETSLYDEESDRLSDFQLSDVFGLKYLGRSDLDPNLIYHNHSSYIIPTEHEVFGGLPKSKLRIYSPYIKTESISGETIAFYCDPVELSLAKLHKLSFPSRGPAEFKGKKAVSWGTTPGKETTFPAIHVNRYGKGKAIFVAGQIFKACRRPLGPAWLQTEKPFNLWWTRGLMANLIKLLDDKPPFHVEAPDTVEATFWKNTKQKQVIVQLLNKTDLETLIPIENIKIQVRNEAFNLKEAYIAWPDKKELEIQKKERIIEINVPKIGMHEIVILQAGGVA